MINSEYICSKTARSHYYSAWVLFVFRSDSHVAVVHRKLFTGPGRIQSVHQTEKKWHALCVCVCVGDTIVKG